MKPEDSYNLERIADALEGILFIKFEYNKSAMKVVDKIKERKKNE